MFHAEYVDGHDFITWLLGVLNKLKNCSFTKLSSAVEEVDRCFGISDLAENILAADKELRRYLNAGGEERVKAVQRRCTLQDPVPKFNFSFRKQCIDHDAPIDHEGMLAVVQLF